MIHYIFVGHFELDGAFIRFEKVKDTTPALYRPVVKYPLEFPIINELLGRRDTNKFPTEWGMSMEDTGYIVWDRFCGSEGASEFIFQLAKRTNCDLADYSSMTLMRADDLNPVT